MTLCGRIVTPITYTVTSAFALRHCTTATQMRTSTVSKSALAITEERNDLADSAFGQLNRLKSRAAARATLEDGSPHPQEIWSAAADLAWTGLAIAERARRVSTAARPIPFGRNISRVSA